MAATTTTCFYAVGTLVNVQPRTGPGINKLGGVGKVTAAHVPNEKTNQPERYDIKYVLGGTEKAVIIDFIDPYQDDIGGRRRGGGESARTMGILKDRNGVLKSSSKGNVGKKQGMMAAKKKIVKEKEKEKEVVVEKVEEEQVVDCCDEDSLIGMTIVVSVAAEDEVEDGKRMEDDDDSCFLASDVSPYRREVAMFSENTGDKRVSLSVPDRTSSKVCLKGLFPEKKRKKKKKKEEEDEEDKKSMKEKLKEKLEEKKKRRKREKKNNKVSGSKNISKKIRNNQKNKSMKGKETDVKECNVTEVGKNIINDNNESNEEEKCKMLTQMNGKECDDFARKKEIITEENDMEAEMPKEKQVVDEIREQVQDVSKEGFSSFSVVVFKAIREGCDMISFHELFQYVNKHGKQSYTEDDTRKYLITLDKKDLLMFCQSSDMIYTI